MQPLSLGLALLGLRAAVAQDIPVGRSTLTLTTDEDSRLRSFTVYRPDPAARRASASEVYGLVLMFHGLSQSASVMLDSYEGVDQADWYNFVAVSLQGILTPHRGPATAWNVGNCCAGNEDDGYATADVEFARDVVDYVTSRLTIDPARIYAMGFSNGAWMTYRLACEASDVFKGFATSGVGPDEYYQGDVFTNCEARAGNGENPPGPMWQVMGTNDDQWDDYNGNPMPGRFDQHSENVMQCDVSGGSEVHTIDGPSGHGTNVGCERYSNCANGTSTVFCTYSGMGHSYPSSTTSPYNLGVTEAAWRYLSGEPTAAPWMGQPETPSMAPTAAAPTEPEPAASPTTPEPTTDAPTPAPTPSFNGATWLRPLWAPTAFTLMGLGFGFGFYT